MFSYIHRIALITQFPCLGVVVFLFCFFKSFTVFELGPVDQVCMLTSKGLQSIVQSFTSGIQSRKTEKEDSEICATTGTSEHTRSPSVAFRLLLVVC